MVLHTVEASTMLYRVVGFRHWEAGGTAWQVPHLQVASVKAVREALDKVSLPTLLVHVPGGAVHARVKAKTGVPKHVRALALGTFASGRCR